MARPSMVNIVTRRGEGAEKRPGSGTAALCRDGTPAEIARLYPHAGPLLGARWTHPLSARS
jgi:hypothetical protein